MVPSRWTAANEAAFQEPAASATHLSEIAVCAFRVGAQPRKALSADVPHIVQAARENIRIGNVELPAGAAETEAAVEAAAGDAGADGVIGSLRRGYETPLAKWFDDGEELSVGEWQKVALARAFVRGAQILVLDQPTSALDPESEWNVFEHIRELAEGRAVVLISNRFSTVRGADRIHILDEGRIVESGTHDELVALSPAGPASRLRGARTACS
jgi:ABC-type multidrug transport system fused ATPase/permease subunit